VSGSIQRDVVLVAGETTTIRWIHHDSGDGVLDTSTLVADWQWIANGGAGTVGTDPIGTHT
jgi:hypothetical protein